MRERGRKKEEKLKLEKKEKESGSWFRPTHAIWARFYIPDLDIVNRAKAG